MLEVAVEQKALDQRVLACALGTQQHHVSALVLDDVDAIGMHSALVSRPVDLAQFVGALPLVDEWFKVLDPAVELFSGVLFGDPDLG